MSTITPLTVVKGSYLAPLDEVDAHRDAHLRLRRGTRGRRPPRAGAGAATPPDGSILVFRGDDADGVRATLANDPYVVAGVVAYEVVGVFTPGRHAPELAEFLAG